jgi:hypothetical protein
MDHILRVQIIQPLRSTRQLRAHVIYEMTVESITTYQMYSVRLRMILDMTVKTSGTAGVRRLPTHARTLPFSSQGDTCEDKTQGREPIHYVMTCHVYVQTQICNDSEKWKDVLIDKTCPDVNFMFKALPDTLSETGYLVRFFSPFGPVGRKT